MKRWPVTLLLMAAAVLAACGTPRKSVFPPSVSVQQLKVLADGEWRLTVRIQNNSYRGMDFDALDGTLQFAPLMPVRLHATFARDIPELASDVVDIDILPTAEMSRALQAIAGKGSAAAVAYRVDGNAHATPEHEKQPRDFAFDGTGWLSPVPGIADTYR